MSDSTGSGVGAIRNISDDYPAVWKYLCEKLEPNKTRDAFLQIPDVVLKIMEDSFMDGEFRIFVPITREVEFRWSQTHKAFVKLEELE